MKKISILLLALLLVGCNKKELDVVEVPKPNTDDVVITTPESITESPKATSSSESNTIDSSQTKHTYVGYGVVDGDYEFFIEGNKCVFDDYVLVRSMKFSQDKNEMGFEIGSHCYDDMSVQGGVVNMMMDNLEEQPSFKIEVPKMYELYYEFPENFEPSTYLNYVDYATKIGEIQNIFNFGNISKSYNHK